MAELKNRYANALFELSLENGVLEENVAQGSKLIEVLREQEIVNFLIHPHIPDTAKKELLKTIQNKLFLNKYSVDINNFFNLTITKSREALIVPALSTFVEMGERYGGKTTATIVSAVALTEKQLDELREMLVDKLKKQVEIITKVNPNLLGGFYIQVDGYIIDRSLRTKLKTLKDKLRRGNAK